MYRTFSRCVKKCKSVWSTRLLVYAIVVTLTALIPGVYAAGGKVFSKGRPMNLGDYLAGRHAQFINDPDAAVRFYRSNLLSNPNNFNIQNQIFKGRAAKHHPQNNHHQNKNHRKNNHHNHRWL